METDRVRQVVAAIVGILVIVALVLLARWTGDRIRERFLAPKVPSPVQVTPVEEQEKPAATGTNTATYSAIPATGPNDLGYALLAFLALGGILSLRVAKRLAAS